MTVLVMVSVRDRAADTFARPFFVPSKGVAIRSFTDEVNRAALDNPLYQHPEDYDLFVLGSFDDVDASVVVGKPFQLAIGKDVAVRTKE